MTLTINTPLGPRSASGVWSFKLLPGDIDYGHHTRFRGEAIPIDLPDGRTVYALLTERNLAEHVLERRFFPDRFPEGVGTSRYNQIDYLREHVRNRVKLDCRTHPRSWNQLYIPSECPRLVAFRNPTDPDTIYELDPFDLTASLGKGYFLDGIYFQVTDDRPTHQLKGRLPWESAVKRGYLDGSEASNRSTLANSLTLYDFKEWD